MALLLSHAFRVRRSRARLLAADRAWLRMERPDRRMVITVLMLTDGAMAPNELSELVRTRLFRYRRFREAPPGRRVNGPANPSLHLSRAPRAPSGERELVRFVEEAMARPLPADRPLWQVHLAERFGAGSALVWRVHHALADGAALVRVLLGIADRPAPLGQEHPPPRRRRLRFRGVRAVAALLRLLLLPRDPRTLLEARPSGRWRGCRLAGGR